MLIARSFAEGKITIGELADAVRQFYTVLPKGMFKNTKARAKSQEPLEEAPKRAKRIATTKFQKSDFDES